MASERCKKGRDRLWRPLIAFAEALSACSVVGVIAVTAQHFVKQESDLVREEANKQTFRRHGDAFLVALTACSAAFAKTSSFRELSAQAILCNTSKTLSSANEAMLDQSLAVLNVLGPLPLELRSALDPETKILITSVQKELEANKRVHFHRLKAETRPIESDYALLAIAAGVLFGASIKCSRAASEWRHGRNEG